jgi:hypothetical protein
VEAARAGDDKLSFLTGEACVVVAGFKDALSFDGRHLSPINKACIGQALGIGRVGQIGRSLLCKLRLNVSGRIIADSA